MRLTANWARLSVGLVLLLAPAGAGAKVQTASDAGYVVYTEETPCPPVAGPHHVRRRVHVRHVVHRTARVRPPVHKVVVKHRVRRRRPHLVKAAAPIAPRRCTVLRREPLTAASFGLTPETVAMEPLADDVLPGGPTTAGPSSGRPPTGDVINPVAGGGNPGGGGPGAPGGGVVSPAPEPAEWALLMLGVAVLGLKLRRRGLGGRVS